MAEFAGNVLKWIVNLNVANQAWDEPSSPTKLTVQQIYSKTLPLRWIKVNAIHSTNGYPEIENVMVIADTRSFLLKKMISRLGGGGVGS